MEGRENVENLSQLMPHMHGTVSAVAPSADRSECQHRAYGKLMAVGGTVRAALFPRCFPHTRGTKVVVPRLDRQIGPLLATCLILRCYLVVYLVVEVVDAYAARSNPSHSGSLIGTMHTEYIYYGQI